MDKTQTVIDLLVNIRWRLQRASTLLDDPDQQQGLRVCETLLSEIQHQLDPIFKRQGG